MNEKIFCVFAIHYTENEHSQRALGKANASMTGAGVFRINAGTYIVKIPDAVSAILAAISVEITSEDRIKNLHFSLIPCGANVFGELPKEVGEGLAALGLAYSETPIPRPLQQH